MTLKNGFRLAKIGGSRPRPNYRNPDEKLHDLPKAVSLRPGPGFNVIIGPNGSGKSSIEIALVIGLGGDVETLKRQTNLGEFVNRDAGDENAEILIRIADDKLVNLKC